MAESLLVSTAVEENRERPLWGRHSRKRYVRTSAHGTHTVEINTAPRLEIPLPSDAIGPVCFGCCANRLQVVYFHFFLDGQ